MFCPHTNFNGYVKSVEGTFSALYHVLYNEFLTLGTLSEANDA